MFKAFVTRCHGAISIPAPARSLKQDTLRTVEQGLAIINLCTAQVEESMDHSTMNEGVI